MPSTPSSAECVRCGACCATLTRGPVLAPDEPGDGLPLVRLSNSRHRHVKAVAGRCVLLSGTVGERVACTRYEARPRICAAFEPGGPACRAARAKAGLSERLG